MKLNLFILALILIMLASACNSKKESHEHKQDAPTRTETLAVDTVKKSIPKEEHALIAGTHFTINYHAPAVRERTIWGGLVPYDEVWVTGAHSATSLKIDKDITINGTKVPAGKYALFTIPGKEQWTIIINRDWDQHLADEYDTREDVTRLQVKPQTLPTVQERLKYTISQSGDSKATIDIRWEKVKVTLPVDIN